MRICHLAYRPALRIPINLRCPTTLKKRNMASLEKPNNTCRDCMALMVGIMQDPHQYLMASARSAHSLGYRCLICDSDLTCELEDWTPRWSAKDGDPRPSMHK